MPRTGRSKSAVRMSFAERTSFPSQQYRQIADFIGQIRSLVSAMVSLYFFCHHIDFFVEFFVEFYVDFFVEFYVECFVEFYVDFFVEFYVDFFVASYVGFYVGFLTTCSTRWRGMQVLWTR